MGRNMRASEAWNLLAGKMGGAMLMYDGMAQALRVSTSSARNVVKGNARLSMEQIGDLLALFAQHLGGSWKMTGLGPVREEQEVLEPEGIR